MISSSQNPETIYFHGGAPEIGVGKMILPPNETKAFTFSPRTDRVYVVTDFLHAVLYAAMHPSKRGAVYRVKPIGVLVSDPDCKIQGLSFSCERAIVVEKMIISPAIMIAAKAAIATS